MIRNKGTESESLTSAIDLMITQRQNSLRSTTLAMVTKVNSGNDDYYNNTINAQPLIAERINTKDDGKQFRLLPEIYNVPFFTGSTPNVGDYCVLIHLDRSYFGNEIEFIENESLGLIYPIVHNVKNSHRLGDCIALCGFNIQYLDDKVSEYRSKTNINSNLKAVNSNSENIYEQLENLNCRLTALENDKSSNDLI